MEHLLLLCGCVEPEWTLIGGGVSPDDAAGLSSAVTSKPMPACDSSSLESCNGDMSEKNGPRSGLRSAAVSDFLNEPLFNYWTGFNLGHRAKRGRSSWSVCAFWKMCKKTAAVQMQSWTGNDFFIFVFMHLKQKSLSLVLVEFHGFGMQKGKYLPVVFGLQTFLLKSSTVLHSSTRPSPADSEDNSCLCFYFICFDL